MLTGCLSFQFLSYSLIPTYPVPCCWPMEKLGQENQFDKLSITVTCPSPLSAAYQFIIQTFCLLASQRDFGGQSLNTQLTVIGIRLRCMDERLENTIWYTQLQCTLTNTILSADARFWKDPARLADRATKPSGVLAFSQLFTPEIIRRWWQWQIWATLAKFFLHKIVWWKILFLEVSKYMWYKILVGLYFWVVNLVKWNGVGRCEESQGMFWIYYKTE